MVVFGNKTICSRKYFCIDYILFAKLGMPLVRLNLVSRMKQQQTQAKPLQQLQKRRKTRPISFKMHPVRRTRVQPISASTSFFGVRGKFCQFLIKTCKSKKLFICPFLLLSLAGLVYHVVDISRLFFSYSAITEFEIKSPKSVAPPSLTICMYYPNFLNRTALINLMQAKKRLDWKKILGSNLSKPLDLQDVQSFLTMKNIFALTPSPDVLLSRCYFRLPGRFFRFKRLNCNEVFSIDKFFYLHNMCYRFAMIKEFIQYNSHDNKTSQYTFHELKHHALVVDLFYEVFLYGRYFKHVTYIEASTFKRKSIPRVNDAFSVSFKRGMITVNNREISRDFYHFSYSRIKNERLPPPYSSQCRDYSETSVHQSQKRCIDDCILKQVQLKLRRLPFTPVISNASLNWLLITTDDLKSQYFAMKLNRIEQKCYEKCPFVDCRDVIYMTRLMRSEPSNTVRFRVETPHEPDIWVKLNPQMYFNDYLIYILNCLGIWLGLSIFDLYRIIYVKNAISKH